MRIKTILAAALLLLVAAVRAAVAQPAIQVAPEDESGRRAPPPGETPATALPRETPIENPLGRAPALVGTAVGGYGELTLNVPENAPAVVDLRRVVLFLGHSFGERLRFYSEIEIEHAVSSADDQGEVEVEQAFLDGLVARRLNLRGGLVLMPVGIVNIYHEPPTFNGVDRPDVDNDVIPTTWREPGIGIFGELAEGLRYQLYLVDGLNANGFGAARTVREGHQEAQLARAGDFGAVARLDYEPWLGTDFGLSVYGASSGNTLGQTVGRVPVGLLELDARTRRGAFSARAELALLLVGDTAALNQALAAAGSMDLPVSSQARGGYAELAYDVLALLHPGSAQSLTAFSRYDYVDTQADVPAGFSALPELRRQSATVGLVYRPLPQAAVKLDYRRHEPGSGPGSNEAASALAWMF